MIKWYAQKSAIQMFKDLFPFQNLLIETCYHTTTRYFNIIFILNRPSLMNICLMKFISNKEATENPAYNVYRLVILLVPVTQLRFLRYYRGFLIDVGSEIEATIPWEVKFIGKFCWKLISVMRNFGRSSAEIC